MPPLSVFSRMFLAFTSSLKDATQLLQYYSWLQDLLSCPWTQPQNGFWKCQNCWTRGQLSRATLLGSLDVNKGSAIWKWPHRHPRSLQVFGTPIKSRATFSWNFLRNFPQRAFDVRFFESRVLTLVFQLMKAQAPAATSWKKHQKNSQRQTIILQNP